MLSFAIRMEHFTIKIITIKLYYNKNTNQSQNITEKHWQGQLLLLNVNKLFLIVLSNIPEEEI